MLPRKRTGSNIVADAVKNMNKMVQIWEIVKQIRIFHHLAYQRCLHCDQVDFGDFGMEKKHCRASVGLRRFEMEKAVVEEVLDIRSASEQVLVVILWKQ